VRWIVQLAVPGIMEADSGTPASVVQILSVMEILGTVVQEVAHWKVSARGE
jgi:hypothetical protein